MEPEELKKYTDFMKENGLTYLEVRKGDFYLILQSGNDTTTVGGARKFQKQESIQEKTVKSVELKEEENLIQVKSPLIGTFYRAPSPQSPPFVEVGVVVKKGTTLCIVEAMKVMNEIKAECTGKVRKILVENGSPVEYGQVLFLLEPVEQQET
ncbi:MAG TPA: acetyl-CoA carboxylase biotin carboxyl carrier protein [bacterium]|nr:acetyl-CoA carboxylase biotin carboxyl carrier protein [bacterium]